MTITKEKIGEIIQHLYDSEIDVHIGWLWDGGFDYIIENNPYPLTTYKGKPESTGDTDIVKAFEWLVKDVLEQFPDSSFAKWFNAEK